MLIETNQKLSSHSFTLNLGNCLGIYVLNYNFDPKQTGESIPCKITLQWDEIIISSGFRGSSSFNTELQNLSFEEVLAEASSGQLILYKDKTAPDFANLVVDSPLHGSEWSFELKCYCDGDSDSDSDSNSDSDSDVIIEYSCGDVFFVFGPPQDENDSDSDSNGESDSDSDDRCRCLCDSDSDNGNDSDTCECVCCEDDICGNCIKKCSQESTWDPNECVEWNPKTVYPVDDGKLPSPLPTYTSENEPSVWVPKIIEISVIGSSDCELDGKYVFENTTASQNSITWNAIAKPSSACQAELLLGSSNAPDSENQFSLIVRGLKNNSILQGSFWLGVRWRELYGDWTVSDFTLNPSNYAPFGYSPNGFYSSYPGFEPGIDSPSEGCSGEGEGGYIDQSSCFQDLQDINGNISLKVSYPNTCRQPEPCPSVGPCKTIVELNTLDKTLGPCDKCYCDGGGRPIDIDKLCTGARKPTTLDFPIETESYILYFDPRGKSALPVVDNVIYDTSNLNSSLFIVKVHTARTPEEMREWVCRYLRFVTVKDYSKLKTDTENAVESNWPFNDLYWGATCNEHPPKDIPINLVPC